MVENWVDWKAESREQSLVAWRGQRKVDLMAQMRAVYSGIQ